MSDTTITIMGRPTSDYALIPNELVCDPAVTPRASRVYAYLATFPGESLPAKEIIDGLNLSRGTVYAALSDLIDLGWIEKCEGGGPGQPVGYRVLAHRHSTEPGSEARHEDVVYYMTDQNIGVCKIGTSRDVFSRMERLSRTSPGVTLNLAAWEPGSYKTERLRHGQFKHLRIVGEWFALRCDLVEHVNALRSAQIEGGKIK